MLDTSGRLRDFAKNHLFAQTAPFSIHFSLIASLKLLPQNLQVISFPRVSSFEHAEGRAFHNSLKHLCLAAAPRESTIQIFADIARANIGHKNIQLPCKKLLLWTNKILSGSVHMAAGKIKAPQAGPHTHIRARTFALTAIYKNARVYVLAMRA